MDRPSSKRRPRSKLRRKTFGHRNHVCHIRWQGWRTEYPEQFPVTITRIAPKEPAQ